MTGRRQPDARKLRTPGASLPGARWVRHIRSGAFGALLVACSWAGCGAPQSVEPLAEVVRMYNDAVRWERFSVAAAHLPAGERDHFLDRRDQIHEDLRINDYNVIRVRYDEGHERARVHIKLTWHLDSQGTVHDTHAVQTWRREDKHWILVREEFLRGKPMPGLGLTDCETACGESVEVLPTSDK